MHDLGDLRNRAGGPLLLAPTFSSQIQCTRITDIRPAMRDNDD